MLKILIESMVLQGAPVGFLGLFLVVISSYVVSSRESLGECGNVFSETSDTSWAIHAYAMPITS